LKELYTDILKRQMGMAVAGNLEVQVLNFGSEIGYMIKIFRGSLQVLQLYLKLGHGLFCFILYFSLSNVFRNRIYT